MRREVRGRVSVLLTLALVCSSGLTYASTVSYAGSFTSDNDKWVLPFTIWVPGSLSIQTFSYSGGVNASGGLVAPGGFAPVLSLFDADGTYFFEDVGSAHTCQGGGGFCWDAAIELAGMGAGDYTLVLTQDANTYVGASGLLTDPSAFTYDGAGNENYTAQYGQDPGARFLQIDGTQRTAAWTLDLSIPEAPGSGTVPEPMSLTLALTALGMALAARRR